MFTFVEIMPIINWQLRYLGSLFKKRREYFIWRNDKKRVIFSPILNLKSIESIVLRIIGFAL